MWSSLTNRLEWLDAMTAALLRPHYQSIDFHLESGLFGPMQLGLILEPSSEQEIVSDKQTYRLQLPGLRNDFCFLWESSNLSCVLDAILLADVPLCIAHKTGLYDLSLYEVCSHSQIPFLTLTGKIILQCLCRRLCACISLLRRLNECTIDKMYNNDYRAVHMVVGFLCQLSRTASSIFTEVFEHIRGCCFTNRDRRGTPRLMIILAEHLGHISKEIRLFMDVKRQIPDPVYSLWPADEP